jgi:hypothetical protein
MNQSARYVIPGIISPIRVAPDKKPMYMKIISSLKEDYTDREFKELNWWDIIMPCLDRHGMKFTLTDIAIVLLVLRKKRFII